MKCIFNFLPPLHFNWKNALNQIFPVIFMGIILYLFSPFRLYSLSPLFEQSEEWLILSCLVVFSFLFILINARSGRIRQIYLNHIDVALILYFLYLGIRICFSEIYIDPLIRLFLLCSLYLYLKSIPIRFYPFLLYAIIMGCFIQIIYGIFNFENPWDSIKDLTGVFHNTGIWGGFVGVSIVILLHLIFYKKQSRIQAVIPWILVIPLLIQLIASHSRASWMGLVVTILYLLGNRFTPGIKALKPGIKAAVFVVTLLFFAWGFQTVYSIKPESAIGRLYIWTVSVRLFTESPVFGIGINQFRSEYMPAQAEFFSENPDSSFKYIADDITNPFNEFLRVGIEQGITGVFFLALFFYCIFLKKEKAENTEAESIRKVFISILLYLAVFAFFSYPFIYIQFDIILIICLAGLSGTIRSAPFSVYSAILPGLSFLMLFAVTLLCLYSINDFRYILEWNRVRNNTAIRTDYKIACYESLYPVLHHYPQFLMTYSRLLMQTNHYKQARKVLDELNRYQVSYRTVMDRGICYQEEGDFDNAQACFEQASYMLPSRFTPDYRIIQIYLEMKNDEKAAAYIERFLARPIKVDSPELGRMMDEVIKWKGEIKDR